MGIIVLFAPRDKACEITRQVVELYVKIKDMSKKLEYTLYSVICAMIDAYFDDEDEFKELMDMMSYETDEDNVGKFETEIISRNKIIELEEEVDNVKAMADEANARADEADARADEADARANEVNAENIKLKAKIMELENKLNNK